MNLHSASQVALVVKGLSAKAGNIRDLGLIPGSGRCPWAWQPTPVFLPGESYEEPGRPQSTAVTESDRTEVT